MAGTRWNEEKSLKFVLAYQKFPCLWNTKSVDYRNRDLRASALIKIIEEMCDNGVSMTTVDVKNRIKSIRTTYAAEVRKIKQSAKSGSGTQDIYVPSCAWFKTADGFLRNTVALRETCDNLDSQSQSTYDEDILSPQNMPNTPEPPHSIDESTPRSNVQRSQKRTKKETPTDVTAAVTKLENICKNSAQALTEDEFDTYGSYIASQLRSMELERAIDVQAQFNNILSRARIEDLKEKKRNAMYISNTPSTSKSPCLNSPPPNSHDLNYSGPASHGQSSDFLNSPPPSYGYGEGYSEMEDSNQMSTNQGSSDILSQAVISILNDDYNNTNI